MDAEFEDDDAYGGDQLIPGAARSNLRNAGAKDDAATVTAIYIQILYYIILILFLIFAFLNQFFEFI